MKEILLIVHDDAGQDARLQAAVDLVRAVEGHLTCLDVVDVSAVAAEAWVMGGQATMTAGAFETEAANGMRVRERLARERISWSWQQAAGDLRNCIRAATGLADVIVASARPDRFFGASPQRYAADLVVRSKTPVLAIPDQASRFAPAGDAMVAWGGSPQSVAALHAATLLLRLARSVTIVEVETDGIAVPAEDAAVYLTRHGISATVVRRPRLAPSVAATLRMEIERRAVGYVVMGGFSHWQITETLFGGVSRDMLKSSPVPLLMAH